MCVCLGVAVLLLAAARDGAAQRPTVEKFEATAMDTSGPTPQRAGHIQIELERWSTEADAVALGAAVPGGSEGLLNAVKTFRPLGVIISPGIQGAGDRARLPRQQSLLYARDITTASGRQVVLATDEHLGFGELRKDRVRSEKNELTVIDLRLGADGKGVGKIGLVDHVTYNKQTKSIELAGFDKLPAGLVDVTVTKR